MEKLRQKIRDRYPLSSLESISVLISYDKLQTRKIETISLSELLDKFPTTQASRIYKNFDIPFVRCLRVFLMNHFNGTPEPLDEKEAIDGLTRSEIKQIESLVLESIKY
ncbi:MAG: hypothetical protein AAF717_21250 [Bacteroidota bacterium]|nr:hypothetical protein [uncultured Allomuricauda sp.]